MINYFTLFDLPQNYTINADDLERKYFALQMQYHPDRSAGQLESDKMLLLKKSADVNEAYHILSDDVERANHLLELNNILVNKEKNNTYKPSQTLLIEQMELRERAAEIETGLDNKAELLSHINAEFLGAKRDFAEHLEKKDLAEAAQSAMKLKYLDKLKNELNK